MVAGDVQFPSGSSLKVFVWEQDVRGRSWEVQGKGGEGGSGSFPFHFLKRAPRGPEHGAAGAQLGLPLDSSMWGARSKLPLSQGWKWSRISAMLWL